MFLKYSERKKKNSMIENKTKIASLCYNAMFKAVFSNNKYMLSRLVQSILDYLEININVDIVECFEMVYSDNKLKVLLNKNISLEDIADITNKSIEELKGIVNSNKE